MFISILIYLLQLLNLGLLFHAVLGYEFRGNKAWWICTLALIVTSLIIRCLYWDNMSPMLGIFFLDGMTVVLPVIVFDGDLLRKLLLSVNYRCVYSAVYGAAVTLCKINMLSVLHPALLTQICFVVLQVLLYVWLKSKRENIHRSVECMNYFLLFSTAVCLIILGREVHISPKAQDAGLQILIGQSQVLSAIIAILLIAGMIFIHRIGEKNKELLYMNQLNQKYLEVQTNQYRKLEEKDLALRSFRHDYKMHMNTLQHYLQKAQYDDAALYLNQLEEMKERIEYISTGNLIADAVLNQYTELGKAEQIDIDCHGIIPQLKSINETDFCALFANAMKNAYEAATTVPGQKTIAVRITNQDGYLFISINNPSAHGLSFYEDTLKTNKAEPDLHGFGSRIMKEIVERNAGAVKWYEIDGHVETKISIRYAEK